MYAIVTTGLTHALSRNSVVAVDVTDPTNPREVAAIPTQAACTEGVIVLPGADAALIGSYCSTTVQMVSLSELGNGKLRATGTRTEAYYENMVSGVYNQSYAFPPTAPAEASAGAGAGAADLLFSATYTDPGGIVIFNASSTADGEVVPTEISRYISNSTARANRVHLHPSGIAFLALEKSHGGDARGGLAAINVTDPRAPTLIEALKTPSNDSRTYCLASATEDTSQRGAPGEKRGVVYAFGATACSMWVYTFPLGPEA